MSEPHSHSPLPWKHRGMFGAVNAKSCAIDSPENPALALCVSPADAELIVSAVNSHAALLDACKAGLVQLLPAEYQQNWDDVLKQWFDDPIARPPEEETIAQLQAAIESASKTL